MPRLRSYGHHLGATVTTPLTTAAEALEAAIRAARDVQTNYDRSAMGASAIEAALEALYMLRSRVQEPVLDVEGLVRAVYAAISNSDPTVESDAVVAEHAIRAWAARQAQGGE